MSQSSPVHARRRKVVAGVLVAFSLLAAGAASAAGSLEEDPDRLKRGTWFGDRNMPAACVAETTDLGDDGTPNPGFWLRNTQTPTCHHMRTDMNGLDSPQIDVLVLVPVSPAAERDMRIMRQSIEMWEQGIDAVADKLEMDWLADGVDFHVTVDAIDPLGADGGEFTTYPIVDPEIVVIATNPTGGIGIGIDPNDFVDDVFGSPTEGEGPCTGLANPLDIAAWEALPGFNSHHEERAGTYNEDCGGSGGNICFAVNGAVDPTPGEGPLEDLFSLYDLVSHEVGHCLSVGHVGDGAEGDWGGLPTNDIMAYSADPGPELNKCVSSLDVESFATVMSRYLDRNADGVVDAADELKANDQTGDGGSPFQVQRPQDHFYASTDGVATSCPQPDLGLVPGPRADFTPDSITLPGDEPTAAPTAP